MGDDPLDTGISEGWIRPAARERVIGTAPRVRADVGTTDVLDDDRCDDRGLEGRA